MDPATRQLIEALHEVPYQYVMALTGGGIGAASALLSVPGGSRTILEVVVPYHEHALTAFLGRVPEHYCSAATAAALADRAFERACWLAPRALVAGIGGTASLATDHPKRGDHHFSLCIRTSHSRASYSLTLTKGARDRGGEEDVVVAVLLNALAETFGVAARVPVPLLGGETVEHAVQRVDDPLAALLAGDTPTLCAGIDARLHRDAPKPTALLPGSFNPLHEGHWRLAQVAAEILGTPIAFELSVTNVDKPPLAAEEVRHRLGQFGWRVPVWLTRAPTFAEKAALFPGTIFVIGADTAVRIVDPRYYEGSDVKVLEALGAIRRQGCRFLVAGRLGADGHFTGCEGIAIPDACRDLFEAIPESRFRCDISSTHLRSGGD
jgi:hypothetical protein